MNSNSLLAYLATSLLVLGVVVEVEVVEVGVVLVVVYVAVEVYVVDTATLWIALVSWVYFTMIYCFKIYNGSTVLEDVTYKQNSLSGGVTCVRVSACVSYPQETKFSALMHALQFFSLRWRRSSNYWRACLVVSGILNQPNKSDFCSVCLEGCNCNFFVIMKLLCY